VPSPREVTVVIDAPRGALPAFTLESPWWQEAEPVVTAVRERFGLEIVVLRLLEGEVPFETPVTYLAELMRGNAAPLLAPWVKPLADDPLRLPYARPGGPDADLAWAARHVTFTGPPVQIRTWNLSSIWKIPTADGLVWLKHVPPFFAHESSMLRALGNDARVPRLIAGEPGRMLLADVPGHDCYEADGDQLEAMLDTLISLQIEWVGREEDLLALGAPDWRRATYLDLAADVVARGAPRDSRLALEAFVARLPSIFDDLDACGVPDTFVHGDFHPGNVRWSQGAPVILDWGDVGVGNPLLDRPAFMERVGERGPALHSRWMRRWEEAVPGSEPARAAELIAPVAQMRQAIIYQRFLDGIEESERVYHRADVPERLASVATMINRRDPTHGRPL
jgi:hypothetical protein